MIITGDSLETLKAMESNSVDCCVTSPPYWGLRDYGMSGQLGAEKTPEEFVINLVTLFREIRRVLKPEGTLWLNLGDSYYNHRPGKGQALSKQTVANNNQDMPTVCHRRGTKLEGLKEKDLIGIPWKVAFALQADGWYLRQDIIWHKPNPMPESVKDRCTKSHEYIFLLTKSPNYYFDYQAIKEPAVCAGTRKSQKKGEFKAKGEPLPGQLPFRAIVDTRHKRSVWTVPTKPFKGAHFATFPTALITPCILAGCPEGGVVLDPFFGSGTTGVVAIENNRKYIGIELNPQYVKIAEKRLGIEPKKETKNEN